MPRVNRREIFADAEIQVFQATLMRTNSTSHLDRMFDNLGRVLTSSNSGTTNIPTTVQTNVYDANSRRTQQTAIVSSVADYKNTWTYDNANRQTQVKQEGQTGGITVAAKRVDFTYNTGGMFTGVKRYNDLAGTQIVANTTYTYDLLARLTALDHKNASGGNLANYTWTFDSDRRITNFTNTDGTSDYTYDTNDQVTVVDHSYQTDESYTYDANGNRTNTGYSTSTNNLVTSDGTYNYTYDNEGNRTARTKISDSTKVEYTWDYRNRLTDVVYKTSGGTVTKKIQYQYDVFDRRIGKKIDANGDSTYETATYWVYDDAGKRDRNTGTSLDDIVLEFNDADGDGSGLATLTTRYLHGPQVDQILASEATSGNVVTWALADHQGTVRDMVRYASGTTTVVNHRKFDAFGNLTAESDATVKFLYSYTGREWDGDAGLYYYRARWYDAKIGRFISEDPMGFGGSDTNLSRYVGNGAPNFTDPTGWQRVRSAATTAPPLNWRDYPEVFVFMANFQAMSNALNTGDPTWWQDYKRYLWNPGDMDRDTRYLFYGFTATAAVAGTAAGGLAAGAYLGVTEIGTVALSQVPTQAALEWQLLTAAATTTGTAAGNQRENLVTLWHRGTLELGGGKISQVRELSTGTCRELVQVLRPNAPPGLIEFRIPMSVLENWERNDLLQKMTDLDLATGSVNEEWRFLGAVASDLAQYIYMVHQ